MGEKRQDSFLSSELVFFSCYLKEEKFSESTSFMKENIASGEDSENIKQNLNFKKKIEPSILNLNIRLLKQND